MTTTISQTTISPVRDRTCPLCLAAPGQACQPKPSADHLARWLDSYTAGQLTKEYMAKVVGELVVVDACAVIPAQAAPGGITGELLVTGQHRLTYVADRVWNGWWADLRRLDGSLIENGCGATQAAALADLERRLGGAR